MTTQLPTPITVTFYGSNLLIVNHNNEPYVPMKPIIEGMGLAWGAQFAKLKQRFNPTVSEIEIVATDGKKREMTCLAMRKLSAWLNTISPNKVNKEIKSKVIAYQEECDDVLYSYWTKGIAVNPRIEPTKPTGKLSKEQRDAIIEVVKFRASRLPKDKQAKAAITMWSSVKSKYGMSYKELSEEHYIDVLSLVARVDLDSEIYLNQFDEVDISHIAWAIKAGDHMREAIERIAPMLEMIEHREAPAFGTMINEYSRVLNNARNVMRPCVLPILQKNKDIVFDRLLPHFQIS